jgi:hypothetical protein
VNCKKEQNCFIIKLLKYCISQDSGVQHFACAPRLVVTRLRAKVTYIPTERIQAFCACVEMTINIIKLYIITRETIDILHSSLDTNVEENQEKPQKNK